MPPNDDSGEVERETTQVDERAKQVFAAQPGLLGCPVHVTLAVFCFAGLGSGLFCVCARAACARVCGRVQMTAPLLRQPALPGGFVRDVSLHCVVGGGKPRVVHVVDDVKLDPVQHEKRRLHLHLARHARRVGSGRAPKHLVTARKPGSPTWISLRT